VVRVGDEDVVKRATDPNLQLGTAYKQLDLMEKLRVRTGENLVHQLNLQISTSSDVPRYDRTSLFSYDADGNIIPSQAEWYYGPQKRLLAAYTLEAKRSSGLFDQARFTPSYQSIEQSRYSRGWGSTRIGANIEKVNVLGLNADLEKKSGKHEVRYGAEYTNNDVQSNAYREHISTGEITYRITRYPGGGSSMSSIAAYVSHTMEVCPKFVISEGLRYTRVDLRSMFNDEEAFQYLNGTYKQGNGSLTWRAGAMFMPGDDWRFGLLASTGFRAPNVDDMGKVFEVSPAVIVVPNTDLKPETTTNFEATISKTFDKRITFDLNGFYTLYDNALVISDFTAGGADSIDVDGTMSQVTALTNKREAYLYGLSGQFTAHFDEHFTMRSGVTWTYGRIRTDSTDYPLDHVPPIYGRTGLEYQAKKLRIEAYVVYNGWKRLRDINTTAGSEDNLSYATSVGVPSWYTLNVRTSFAFTNNLSLQVALENIADDFYRVYASGVSAPGRNLVASLRANF
jgi:hemoglobin/transferrin/lactoferrin receptor protein